MLLVLKHVFPYYIHFWNSIIVFWRKVTRGYISKHLPNFLFVSLPPGEEANQWLRHHLDHPPLLWRGCLRWREHSQAHSAKWIQGKSCKLKNCIKQDFFFCLFWQIVSPSSVPISLCSLDSPSPCNVTITKNPKRSRALFHLTFGYCQVLNGDHRETIFIISFK